MDVFSRMDRALMRGEADPDVLPRSLDPSELPLWSEYCTVYGADTAHDMSF